MMVCFRILSLFFLLFLHPPEGKTFVGEFLSGVRMVTAVTPNHNKKTYPVAMNSNPFSSIQPRPKLPVEPDEFDDREINAYYDWRNDMFFREFDLTGSGSVNFMTARRTYKVWLDDFGTPVVLTMGDPVFYWIDLNGNGKFEQELGEMFKDSYEDGVTGNEEPYDNSDLQEPAGPGPQWNPPQH
jgi:hypothetical protein